MSYKDFTLEDLRDKFGIHFQHKKLFENTQLIEPTNLLKQILARSNSFSLTTEKAKSEAIVFPILAEIMERNKKSISVFSGEILNADRKAGLSGECDFLITKDPEIPRLTVPIISVIEAKKSDMDSGVDQCAAQLVGIRVFNEKKLKFLDSIYGCVTNANDWKFLKLQNNIITIDTDTYFIKDLPLILGAFQTIIDNCK